MNPLTEHADWFGVLSAWHPSEILESVYLLYFDVHPTDLDGYDELLERLNVVVVQAIGSFLPWVRLVGECLRLIHLQYSDVYDDIFVSV